MQILGLSQYLLLQTASPDALIRLKESDLVKQNNPSALILQASQIVEGLRNFDSETCRQWKTIVEFEILKDTSFDVLIEEKKDSDICKQTVS